MSSRTVALETASPARQANNAARILVLLCLGHFMVDLYSGALGTLQPLLQDRYALSFTEAGILGGVLSFSSSVMQPFYGYLSDRSHSRLFCVLGPAIVGIFISSLGLAHGYWGLLAMVAIGGTGIASFHPQAASNATAGIRSNRGRAMAVFICSGTIGLAVGPTVFSMIAGNRGLAQVQWAALPGIGMTVLLFLLLPPLAGQTRLKQRFDWSELHSVRRPLAMLYFLVVIRSVVQITFTQFLPLYLHTQRGYSLADSSYALSLYLFGGALGGLTGGGLADRIGGRSVILISMLGSIPFLILFVFTSGVASMAGLFVSGVLLLFTIPVNVVMAQAMVPTQAGTVSALMMGFGWGMAGLVFIPLTGWISDVLSMQTAFAGLIAFPLAGYFLALKLPK